MALKVGLTGGIGCGKSTVLQLFKDLGIPCFEADSIARGYYNQSDFVSQLCSLLGNEIIAPDGTVNRTAVADIVFADKSLLLELNKLVHGRVIDQFNFWCSQQHAPYVVFESAILYEYNFDRMMDKMVAVYVDDEERIARVMQRDHVSRASVEARINNQYPAKYALMNADYVILNHEGNPRRRQVEFVHKSIIAAL